MKSRLKQLFGIDLRTLASMRIGLASLVVVDLARRSCDLSAFYTDGGVLPRTVLIEEFLTRWEWSFHLFNGTAYFQALLFLIAAGVSVAMLVGYKTRIATVATWVLLCSLQTRNPAINFGADNALRLFLFWSMFLPLGAAWSLDAVRRPKRLDNPHVSFAGVAFMAQLVFIYVFTVIQKDDPAWRSDFTAVYYALSLDEMVTSLGLVVRSHPLLMKALTFATIVCEAVAPVLVFSPFQTAKIRVAVVLTMMALHLGMGLCLAIGIFPFVMWVGWWVFIPGQLWDAIGAKIGSPAGAAGISGPPTALGRTLCGMKMAVLIAALLYVFLYNLRFTGSKGYVAVTSRPYHAFGTILNLKQNWGVFAPRPHVGDGWYVMPAELVNGESVDLFREGAPVRFDKPERVADAYPNERWQKYLVHFRNPESRRHMPHYLDYLCGRWNRSHLGTPRMAQSVRVYFMEEATLPGGGTRPVEKRLLAEHECR